MSGLELLPLDLDALAQSDTAQLVIRHPVTGAASSTVFTIAGPEHAVRKALVFARMRAARKEFEKTGSITVTDPLDDEDAETELMARCTLGWSGLTAGGTAVTHSLDAARKLYSEPRSRWVRDQVKTGLDKLELFIASSAPA